MPVAYVPRPTDLAALKVAILGPSQAAKTCAFGMGGVGKTTIAASLVHEHDVQSSFDKICWVSLGQDPAVRDVQNSIHFQLRKHMLPEHAKEQIEVVQALKDELRPEWTSRQFLLKKKGLERCPASKGQPSEVEQTLCFVI